MRQLYRLIKIIEDLEIISLVLSLHTMHKHKACIATEFGALLQSDLISETEYL